MNFVDIVIIVLMLLGGFAGFRKGAIRTIVQLIGSISVIILAYTFKDALADFVMGFMPFIHFGGLFTGISSINIIFYELVSFLVIFILLYCVLNILLNISGLIDTITKLTVVFDLPSRIIGAIVGLLDGLVYAFLICFVALQLNVTTKYVNESTLGIILLERTPFISQVTAKTTVTMEKIYEIISTASEEERKNLDKDVLQELVTYQIITKEEATKYMEDKKIEIENFTFA